MGYLREPSNGKSASRSSRARVDRRLSVYSSSSSSAAKPTGIKKHKHRSKKHASRKLSEHLERELGLRGGFIPGAPFLVEIIKAITKKILGGDFDQIVKLLLKKSGKSFLFPHYKAFSQAVGVVSTIGDLQDIYEKYFEEHPDIPRPPGLFEALQKLRKPAESKNPGVFVMSEDLKDIMKSLEDSGVLAGAVKTVDEGAEKNGMPLDMPASVTQQLSDGPGLLGLLGLELGALELGALAPYVVFAIVMLATLGVAYGGYKLGAAIGKYLDEDQPLSEQGSAEEVAQQMIDAVIDGAEAAIASEDAYSTIPEEPIKEGVQLVNTRQVPSCPHKIHGESVWDCVVFDCLEACSQCDSVIGPAPANGTFKCGGCGGKKVPQKETRTIPACPFGLHDSIIKCLANACLRSCIACRVSLFKKTDGGPAICLGCKLEKAGLKAGLNMSTKAKHGKKRKSNDWDLEDDTQPNKKTKHENKTKHSHKSKHGDKPKHSNKTKTHQKEPKEDLAFAFVPPNKNKS
ncbi:hypothetical protein F4810DRAFT_722604 [Camillea tinctor]|nr:hypothetical protein F4810DRAFT_722604 [Camillea tinctor]